MNLLEGGDQTPNKEQALQDIIAKWKDKPSDEILKAKAEADLHIKAVEREKAELRQMYLEQREELLAKAKFEEYIDQISKPRTEVAITPAKEDSPKYDPREVEKLVMDKIQETERSKTEAQNFNKVQSKLQERFGNSYSSVLKDQQQTLGLSDVEINDLAKKSPEAFFRLMGLNDTPKDLFQAPPRSGQRNDNFSPRGAPVRDWNYYQELKKTNPKMYLDPKISLQMEKDAMALGDRFGMPSD